MTNSKRTGPVGYTGFVHPAARINTKQFSIGGASLIEPFVSLDGESAKIGVACNLQDNDRLLDFAGAGKQAAGDLELGDGAFTAHGVTFVGKVRIGHACGIVINAVVQNAVVGDGTLIGPMARVLGQNPEQPIVIPEASLVLFGARITSQEQVAANVIPVPAPFSLFAADVSQENLVLARGYNLLYRAAARLSPFSSAAEDPRNPGADFPNDERQRHGKRRIRLDRPNGMRIAALTNVTDDSRTLLIDGLAPRRPMTPQSRTNDVGHSGAAVHLVAHGRFFGNTCPARGVEMLRGAWCGFRWSDHANYFTPATLTLMASAAGFAVNRMGFLDRQPLSESMYSVLRPR